jgi:hypothetical protein
MSSDAPKTQFKLSDITGPYPLLGAFLLIFESLLGFWLFRASAAPERIVAGTLMALLMAGFLFVVLRMQKEKISVPAPANLPGKLTAGTELATKQEIEKPEPEKIAGPDRSYLINKPPTNWSTRELTLPEFLAQRVKLDPALGEKLFGSQPAASEILVFKSSSDTTVVPSPGKTTVDGRILPSALTATIPTQLSILPMERYAAPLFVERSLLHNFLAFMGPILTAAPLTLRDLRVGVLPNTQRKYLQAQLRQEIRNATVNGKEGLNVESNITLLAIDGELRDHLLIMNYASLLEGSDPKLDQDLEELLLLANSFRPLEMTNSVERKTEIKDRIDKEFKEFVKANGESMFYSEFVLAALRYDQEDLEDLERRTEAINIFKPFEALAKELKLDQKKLDEFWLALKAAEKGDATDLKLLIGELREAALSKDGAGNQLDQGAESKDDGGRVEGVVSGSDPGGSGP